MVTRNHLQRTKLPFGASPDYRRRGRRDVSYPLDCETDVSLRIGIPAATRGAGGAVIWALTTMVAPTDNSAK
jgi:hypothetical protein